MCKYSTLGEPPPPEKICEHRTREENLHRSNLMTETPRENGVAHAFISFSIHLLESLIVPVI